MSILLTISGYKNPDDYPGLRDTVAEVLRKQNMDDMRPWAARRVHTFDGGSCRAVDRPHLFMRVTFVGMFSEEQRLPSEQIITMRNAVCAALTTKSQDEREQREIEKSSFIVEGHGGPTWISPLKGTGW